MKPKKLKCSASWLLVILASLLFMCGLSLTPSKQLITHADDTPTPSPTPTPDEEKERLQRAADLAALKQAKAEADKAIAEAKKAELEAMFPKPSTSALEGKTTVEGAVIESQMISYVSLAKAADRIVDSIRTRFKSGDNLAIYNERDVNSLLNYQVATSQVNAVAQAYCQIMTPSATNGLCPVAVPTQTPCPSPSPSPSVAASPETTPQPVPPLAPLAIAQSFLGAFVDMTALLRTNVEIKGQTFTVDEGPLAAEVFRSARGEIPFYLPSNGPTPAPINGITLYYPYVFPPNVNAYEPSVILGRLENVHRLRGNAAQLIDAIEKGSEQLKKKEAEIVELRKAIGTTLPEQTSDVVAISGVLIKANCRRLSRDVDDILKQPKPLQAEAITRLIDNKVQKSCPRIDPDKFAQLLGLKNQLAKIAAAMADATTALTTAQARKTELEQDLREQLAKLRLGTSSTAVDLKTRATAAVAQLKAINAQFENLVTSLIQPQSGSNPLTEYIRIERLTSAAPTVPCDRSYWLVLKVINAGGNNRIKTNLVTDIFRGGNRLSHSGGVIVQYHLFASNGVSVRSGTVAEYTDYIDSRRVRALTEKKP